MSYQDEYQQSIAQREQFWEQKARALPWYRFPQTIVEQQDDGIARWFVDGEMNTCFMALDAHTGETVFKVLTGAGKNFDNNWAPISLGADGTAYVGTLSGMISIRDGAE